MLNNSAADCRWLGENGAADAARIITFLGTIGIEVRTAPVSKSILPGMTVQHGAIIIDPETPAWPGDLLHDAGHIAMTDPALRATLTEVSDDPGEEMGAIAWSVAAATKIGLSLDTLFHAKGYKGGGEAYAEAFRNGQGFGVPMLALYGLSAETHRAKEQGLAPFPAMRKWLR